MNRPPDEHAIGAACDRLKEVGLDRAADLTTVTSIEIVAIEDYHHGSN